MVRYEEASAFLNSGNSFGAAGIIGTNDNNSISIETNNVTRLTLGTDGILSFVGGANTQKRILVNQGDLVQGYSDPLPEGMVLDVRHGSSTTPITIANPTLQVNRFENYAAFVGDNNVDNEVNAAIIGKVNCADGSKQQLCAVLGFARGAPSQTDVVGLSGTGALFSQDGSSTGIGTGLFVEGRGDGPNARGVGAEIRVSNYGGSGGSPNGKIADFNPIGANAFACLWLTAFGGAGYRNSAYVSCEGKAQVGIGFTDDSVENADGSGTGCSVLYDNSKAERTIYVPDIASKNWVIDSLGAAGLRMAGQIVLKTRSAPAVSGSGEAVIYFNGTKLRASENGGAYIDLV